MNNTNHLSMVSDVSPYSIIAGNPGCEIRKRFSPSVFEELEQFAWWD